MATKKDKTAHQNQKDHHSQEQKHQQQKTRQASGSKKTSQVSMPHHEQELPETRMVR